MNDTADNNICLKSINELLDYKFFIPKYQRGYRWKNEQVTQLLNDIWEFHKKDKIKDEFYCLQPVVVKKWSIDNNFEYELIDGQQRLTTIFIILSYLNDVMTMLGKQVYSFRFETRKDSEKFLQNINSNDGDKNIDYFHICQSYKLVEEWFAGKDGMIKIHFLTTLLNENTTGNDVKVIWYEVEDSAKNQIEIFTRLNMGKIPLTNSELIKALFLQSSNFAGAKDNEIRLKQLEIATEWDRIEYTLQNDEFWYFINNGNNSNQYDTRIEYIFDLMKDKNPSHNKYHTFSEFSGEFDKNKDKNKVIDSIWLDIRRYFLTFEEWYADRDLYHLIGYLVETGVKVNELKAESQNQTKTEFKNSLRKKIKQKLNVSDIKTLRYGDSDEKIKCVLLLFNIQTILDNEESNIRFPFDKFRKDKWDIEHILSQAAEDISNDHDRRQWAKNVLNFFKDTNDLKKYVDRLQNLINAKTISHDEFNDIYDILNEYFKECTHYEGMHSIGNLTLLDAKTNRSYKNTFFSIKRQTILDNEKKGTFVPICTKNVFLKSYSKNIIEMNMRWEETDANDYIQEIENTLKSGGFL